MLEDQEQYQCCYCDEEFSEDDIQEINGDYYCQSCIDDNFSICEDCGEYIPNDDIIQTGEGNYVCDNCLQQNYSRCNDCEEYFSDSDILTDNNGCQLCSNCRDNYYICENCEEFVHSDNAFFHDGECYCEYCYDNLELNNIIQDYNYKPSPIFYNLHDENTNTFFGIELEIDGAGEDNGNAEYITENINYNNEHVYCKHDGSLTDGFEIVFHPMSYNYITNIKNDIKKMLEYAKEKEYTSHDCGTCGMHIHVSRKAFGNDEQEQDYNISKILYIFEKYWENIVKFSRRSEEQLNRWAKRYLEKDEQENIPENEKPNFLIDKAKKSGRYFAVNLENTHTVEFRLFRGTLKENTFFATIQFLNSLITVIKNTNIQNLQLLTWEQITNINNEIELTQYLKERRL